MRCSSGPILHVLVAGWHPRRAGRKVRSAVRRPRAGSAQPPAAVGPADEVAHLPARPLPDGPRWVGVSTRRRRTAAKRRQAEPVGQEGAGFEVGGDRRRCTQRSVRPAWRPAGGAEGSRQGDVGQRARRTVVSLARYPPERSDRPLAEGSGRRMSRSLTLPAADALCRQAACSSAALLRRRDR